MNIRSVRQDDIQAISEIYNYYVEHTVVTFSETPVSVHEMQSLIQQVTKTCPWLVAEEENLILGYTFVMPWKVRSAYRFTVESTVYLRPDRSGKGLGTRLYQSLFEKLESTEIHRVVGCIALPNPASVALHEKFGFKKVAHFSEVGCKFGHWIDVGYWQKCMESQSTGF